MPVIDQGINLNRYMLIPRTLIFLTRGDKVLLIKGSEYKRLWPDLYNGIGGHIEQGEDVLGAARRELYEETGLKANDLWLCGCVIVDTKVNPGVGIFVFRGECQEGEPRPSNEGSLEWISITAISKLPLVEDLPILLPKIIASQKGSPPFSAHSSYDESGNIVISFY